MSYNGRGPSKKVTLEKVANEVGLAISSVSRILSGDTRGVFKPTQETVKRVLDIASQMGYKHPAILRNYQRRSARRNLWQTIVMHVCDDNKNKIGKATAQLNNISSNGIFMGPINFEGAVPQFGKFMIDVEVSLPTGDKVRGLFRPIRMEYSEETAQPNVGFEIVEMSKKHKLLVDKFAKLEK